MMDFQERTARERLDHLFTFDLTADPLTQRIIDWRDGDPPIGITPTQEYSALKVYAVALHRGTHRSISTRWLPGYLNEWVWKWNHRDDDKAMFRQLLDSAATA